MAIVLTAGLILLMVMAMGAAISGSLVLIERLSWRHKTLRLISGAEALLRSSS